MDIQAYSVPYERLQALGFTDGDLQLCANRGYSPNDVWEEIKAIMDMGLTTEECAWSTFFNEVHPEIQLLADAPPVEVKEEPVALKYGKDDKLKNEIGNYLGIMQNDERYANIRYNEMSGRAEIHLEEGGKLKIVPWSDADEAQSMMYIESKYGLYNKDKHGSALRILFESRSYNPIIDIVDNIEWDGKPRCREFLHEWAKVEDSPYSREVSRLIFAGGMFIFFISGFVSSELF